MKKKGVFFAMKGCVSKCFLQQKIYFTQIENKNAIYFVN